jgi:membrane-associated PAP2 superfamily phosphatase
MDWNPAPDRGMTAQMTAIGGRGTGRRLSLHGLRRVATRLRLSLSTGIRPTEPVALAFFALAGLSLFFVLLPGSDLAVSRFFYRPETGFYLAADPALKALRKSSTYVLATIVLVLLGLIVAGLRTRAPRWRRYGQRAVLLLAGLAIGPGLVVNTFLKSTWGRARPVQVDLFGGDAAFTPAWMISDGCARNCSFVSGEGSSAAWMVAAVFLISPPEWRRWTVPPALAYGAALSLNRVAFGGHFLSDTLLSWAIILLVLAILHRLTLADPVEARRARRARRGRPAAVPVA